MISAMMEGAKLSRRLFIDRSCLSKVRHWTREAAESKVRRLCSAQNEDNIEAYRCAFCAGWHVGHAK